MKRKADAHWQGDLKDGRGTMRLGSGAYEGKYSFGSRFEEAPGTNPEELIGAAHAGCFSMAFAAALASEGHEPKNVRTQATVRLEKQDGGFAITGIHLSTEAEVPGIAEADFRRIADGAKVNCPVSRALSAVPIELDATMV
jgi:osmotically inducible protein OsmC